MMCCPRQVSWLIIGEGRILLPKTCRLASSWRGIAFCKSKACLLTRNWRRLHSIAQGVSPDYLMEGIAIYCPRLEGIEFCCPRLERIAHCMSKTSRVSWLLIGEDCTLNVQDVSPGPTITVVFTVTYFLKLRTESLAYENRHLKITETKTFSFILLMTLKSPYVSLSRKLSLFFMVKYHAENSILNPRYDCNPRPWSVVWKVCTQLPRHDSGLLIEEDCPRRVSWLIELETEDCAVARNVSSG